MGTIIASMEGMLVDLQGLAPAQVVILGTLVPTVKYLPCAKQLQIQQMMVQIQTSTALTAGLSVELQVLAPAILVLLMALEARTVLHA
jgi:hypothetical protein